MPVLVQQKVDASDFFNRSWAEYKAGFGDISGNYWLGNDQLSQLTQTGRYKLRFDLQARNGSRYYAEYSSFVVLNEAYNYRLQLISGYSGDAGDALLNHDGTEFSTYDRDNDEYGYNCAKQNGGGCWFIKCGNCNFNNDGGNGGVRFRWSLRHSLYLQSSRMWLTC